MHLQAVALPNLNPHSSAQMHNPPPASNITWLDALLLSLAEVAGAFLGAVLHWLHFYPHWRTLPEPAGEHGEDRCGRARFASARVSVEPGV